MAETQNPNMGIIQGRLTRDAEAMGSSGNALKFRIAVPGAGRNRSDRDDTTGFFDVVTFGEERVNKFTSALKKGSVVTLGFRLQQNRWKTDDGNERSVNVLIAEQVTVDQMPQGAAPEPQAEESDIDGDWSF